MTEPARILMVRHGHSEANALGRFAFRRWDPGLTTLGWEQARSLVASLAGIPIERIVSSPLRRARETVAPLAEARGLDVADLPGLAELDMGRWDGHPLGELAQSDAAAWGAWRRDPEASPPPRGERISQVGARVIAALDSLAAVPGITVASTHADCLKGALVHLLGVSGPASRRLDVPNLGQLLLTQSPRGWRITLGGPSTI